MKLIRSLPAIMWVSLGAVLLAVAFTMGSGGASVVHATPVADDCTDVPDTGPNFNFHGPCAAHDVCYGTYGGGTYSPAKEAARAACDVQFYNDMLAWCSNAYKTHALTAQGYASCRTTAQIYYAGVRAFGAFFFYNNIPG